MGRNLGGLEQSDVRTSDVLQSKDVCKARRYHLMIFSCLGNNSLTIIYVTETTAVDIILQLQSVANGFKWLSLHVAEKTFLHF